MSPFWIRSLATLLVAGLLSLVMWPFFGPVGALVLFCLLLFGILGFHLRQIARLVYWVQHPSLDTVPETFGSWELVFNHLYQMVREQTRSQQKLTNALDRFVSAGEAMPDGVVVLNEKNRIEWCNPVAMRQLNLDRRKDIGQQISYLVRSPDFGEYLQRQDFSQPLSLRAGRNQDRRDHRRSARRRRARPHHRPRSALGRAPRPRCLAGVRGRGDGHGDQARRRAGAASGR